MNAAISRPENIHRKLLQYFRTSLRTFRLATFDTLLRANHLNECDSFQFQLETLVLTVRKRYNLLATRRFSYAAFNRSYAAPEKPRSSNDTTSGR